MLREVTSYTLFTILMMVCLMAIAIAKSIAPKRFIDFILVISNSKYLKIYGKEQKFLDYFDALLFINLIISGAIFCILFVKHLSINATANATVTVKFIVGIGIFTIAKVLLERLIASLFQIEDIIGDYLFQKISYKNYLGLLLLPINAILVFGLHPTTTLLYILFVVLSLLNISGLLTTYKAHQNTIKTNLFYFILYLCALEIAPYIIIYSVIC